MWQRCRKDVTKMWQRCDKDVTKKWQRCLKDVTKMSQRCDKDVSKMWASWKLEGAGAGPDKSEAVPHSGNGGCQCGVIIVIYSTLQQRYPLKIRLAFRQGSFNSLKYFPFTLVPCYSLFQPITLFYALRRMNRSGELVLIWGILAHNSFFHTISWLSPQCIV